MAQTEEEHQTVRGAEEENKTDSLETTRSTTTTDKTAVSVKRRAREKASFFFLKKISPDKALKLDPRSITTDKRTFSFTYGQPLLKLYIHIYIFDYRYILFLFYTR